MPLSRETFAMPAARRAPVSSACGRPACIFMHCNPERRMRASATYRDIGPGSRRPSQPWLPRFRGACGGLACIGGRPSGRGLGCGGGLPGVSRSVLRAGRVQFGSFRRHRGLPDGRRGRAARRVPLPAQAGRAAVHLPAVCGRRAHRARRHPAGCGGGLADGGEHGRPAGHAVPGPAAAQARVAGRAGYGQADIVLAAAVLYDLALPGTSRRKGAAIGLAAGIKLTPAIFVAYLLITRRYRAAATAAAVFAGTVAAGFAVLPASSGWYWAGEFASPGRVSPVEDPEYQSLLGVLSRMLHTADVLPLWLPLAAAVAVTGLALAAAAGRRGDEAVGFSLCAVTGLLVSPISWTHHWVIAIPALLVAGTAVSGAWRAGNTAAARLGAAASAAVAVTGWTP